METESNRLWARQSLRIVNVLEGIIEDVSENNL
jgi:hypothetical protein